MITKNSDEGNWKEGGQLDQVPLDKVFTDKASGKDTKRPELDALLSFVREGDTVVVHSMDRLARNLDDLRRVENATQLSCLNSCPLSTQ